MVWRTLTTPGGSRIEVMEETSARPEHGLAVHIDGARIFNAVAASGAGGRWRLWGHHQFCFSGSRCAGRVDHLRPRRRHRRDPLPPQADGRGHAAGRCHRGGSPSRPRRPGASRRGSRPRQEARGGSCASFPWRRRPRPDRDQHGSGGCRGAGHGLAGGEGPPRPRRRQANRRWAPRGVSSPTGTSARPTSTAWWRPLVTGSQPGSQVIVSLPSVPGSREPEGRDERNCSSPAPTCCDTADDPRMVLREMCLEGPEEALTHTEHAQPASTPSPTLWRPSGRQSPTRWPWPTLLGEYTLAAAGHSASPRVSASSQRGDDGRRRMNRSGMAALISVNPAMRRRSPGAQGQGGRLSVANLNARARSSSGAEGSRMAGGERPVRGSA